MNYCPFCQLPLDRPVDQCPSCNADLSEHQQPAALPGTLSGSVEDVRAHFRGQGGTPMESTEQVPPLLGTRKDRTPGGRRPIPTVPLPRIKTPGNPPSARPEEAADTALPFRPVNRPPTLILCALDDGSREEGEWYRVRKSEFRIGRTEGDPNHPNDIVIANDNGISSIHVEIKLRIEEGRYRYYLRDWPSRNGTFVRVSRAAIRPEQELLIGARRYFLSTAGGNTSQARLVEMTPRGRHNEFPLADGDNTLGKDASQCTITITGDPFVSSAHARIFKDKKQRWIIENLNSLNGIWLRIEEMPLDTGGEFQIGEQRFLVRIP